MSDNMGTNTINSVNMADARLAYDQAVINERKAIRQANVEYQHSTPLPQEVMTAMATATASLVATSYTKYKNGKYILDMSSYQAKADKTTNVNWDKIAQVAPWVIGGYAKLGEVCDRTYSQNEDDFLDYSFKTNVEGMRRNHMLCGAYVYLNTGLFGSQMGMGLDDYRNWRRPTEEETLKRILDIDIQVHMIMRQLKEGFGRAPDYSKLKAMPTRDIHFIVLDVEKYKVFYGTWSDRVVPDFEIALNAQVTAEELQWLMDHGYLPQMPILIYSGYYFIAEHGPVYLNELVSHYDTIPAGYWYNLGNTHTTWDEIKNTYFAAIPDSWHPQYFGGLDTYGKKVAWLQITGDRFNTDEILNNMNVPSNIDFNYANFANLQAIADHYPLWTDWKELGSGIPPVVVDPPVDPPIPPVVTPKKTFITIANPGSNAINVRSSSSATSPIIPTQVYNGAKYETSGSKVISGVYTWQKFIREEWICVNYNGTDWVKWTEE
jgi:hypothetical protein